MLVCLLTELLNGSTHGDRCSIGDNGQKVEAACYAWGAYKIAEDGARGIENRCGHESQITQFSFNIVCYALNFQLALL